jgi:hypothetical protein
MTSNREAARKNLINAVKIVTQAMKRRDPQEPGKREKEAAEARIMGVVMQALGKQAEVVKWQLETQFPDRKAITKPKITLPDWDEEDLGALIRELNRAALHGIQLWGTGKPVINYQLVNTEAARWARNYSFDLVKGINDFTRKVLQNAVDTFISTPGYSIGDLMDQLPFDAVRAQRIAVTETTRSYAQGQQLAGEELKKEFPDVRVIKTWYTNNDEIVRECEICWPLEGVEVGINEDFTDGIANPPAHPNCRCWTESSTDILGGQA